jgi:N-methylhydantoinase A
MTNEAIVAGLPVAIAIMDLHTVGAGGGSIARIDVGGSLRVGPESAGADPGPACYGRSLLPTVTDAHVVLGHFGGAVLLGGEFPLNETRSREAFEGLAGEMSKAAGQKISAVKAAQGVLSVVNINMERALRRISVERGHDARSFALLPFGGAGGLHAVALARALRIPRIIAPVAAGALSAIGVVTADVIKDASRTVMLKVAPGIQKNLDSLFRDMESTSRAALLGEGFPRAKQRHDRSLAMRYLGQSFELELKDIKGDLAQSFHRLHRARYGYDERSNTVEIVSARLRSIGLVERLKENRTRRARKNEVTPRYSSSYFDGEKLRVAVYRREELHPGTTIRTPCIVTEYSATTLAPPRTEVRIDSHGNLIIETGV